MNARAVFRGINLISVAINRLTRPGIETTRALGPRPFFDPYSFVLILHFYPLVFHWLYMIRVKFQSLASCGNLASWLCLRAAQGIILCEEYCLLEIGK